MMISTGDVLEQQTGTSKQRNSSCLRNDSEEERMSESQRTEGAWGKESFMAVCGT